MSALLHDVLHQQHALTADKLAARLSDIQLAASSTSTTSSTVEGGQETVVTTQTTTVSIPTIIGTGPTSPPPPSPPSPDSEGDELIGVQSAYVSPRSTSRPTSRPTSPTRIGAVNRPLPGPLHLAPTPTKAPRGGPSRDPLKVLPTDVSQRIFGLLSINQLAKCARVSRKWNRSQTLNYVWFQYYRKENFHDESLPPGMWTRRESKQNWRITFLDTRKKAAKEASLNAGLSFGSSYYLASGTRSPSGTRTPSHAGSGYQTPREIREERWRAEADQTSPSKNEMREMYKELNGRKAKSKSKYQTNVSSRDKGGWTEGHEYS